MEELRELVKHTSDENTKKKILEILQTWGMAFRNSPKYRIVTDTLNLMKAEGWKFPPVREAEAMFEADTAPNWEEGATVCFRCRTSFRILITKKYHCRACGHAFCEKCCNNTCKKIPKFNIIEEVRVCDSCYESYGPKEANDNTRPSNTSPLKTSKTDLLDSDLPAEYLASPLSQQPQTPASKSGKSEEELKEEEELQLAIALSQSEAQAKEEQKKRATSGGTFSSPNEPSKSSLINEKPSGLPQQAENSDEISPELMRYLDRDYWEKKEKEKAELKAIALSDANTSSLVEKKVQETKSKTSFPEENTTISGVSSDTMATVQNHVIQPNIPPALAGGANKEELDEFVTTLKTQVEIFVNRMKSNSSRGRSITNDSSVQTLFMNTMAMHSKLLKHIQDQEDKRVYYEGLQDKLTQVKDARAALDALREEERERKRREAEEAERIRQIQMREKLEVMRKKKQEYLQYQRQVALQRMQEQEMEMKLRQEQVKQQYSMNMQPGMGYPPNIYAQQMAQQPGMYQSMPGQNPGVLPTLPQGSYIPQYNPSLAAPPGQPPMHYPPTHSIPPQQQHPPITAPQAQLPGQSNVGSSGVAEMSSNSLGSNNRVPGGNEVPHQSGVPFNMSAMAASLPQPPVSANQYNLQQHQPPHHHVGPNESGNVPSFSNPALQQNAPQPGVPTTPLQHQQPQQQSNVADPNMNQQPTEPPSLISFD